MSARLPLALLLVCSLAAQPLLDFPTSLQVQGKPLEVLIRRSTLRTSGEPCLVVRYRTHIPLSDWRMACVEAKAVWKALQPLATREQVRTGVVRASEPDPEPGRKPRSLGWVWKLDPKGEWKPPAEGDLDLVPR